MPNILGWRVGTRIRRPALGGTSTQRDGTVVWLIDDDKICIHWDINKTIETWTVDAIAHRRIRQITGDEHGT